MTTLHASKAQGKFSFNKMRIILCLNGTLIFLLLLLVAWWTYIIVHLFDINQGIQAEIQNGAHLFSTNTLFKKIDKNFYRMLMWEGVTFIVLILGISLSLLYMYFRDLKKNQAMQTFFSSLSHELKTPLTSIHLQSEVMGENLNSLLENAAEQSSDNHNIHQLQKIKKLNDRLLTDSIKLENQMDKILHLGRIERGGNLSITSIDLYQLLFQKLTPHFPHIIFELEVNGEKCLGDFQDQKLFLQKVALPHVLADEFALEVILKNLFENSLNHGNISANQKGIHIQLNFHSPALKSNSLIQIIYQDRGKYLGDPKKFANLFYKINSQKGSGIGMYLCRKLVEQMNGQFTLLNVSPYTVSMTLPTDAEHFNQANDTL